MNLRRIIWLFTMVGAVLGLAMWAPLRASHPALQPALTLGAALLMALLYAVWERVRQRQLARLLGFDYQAALPKAEVDALMAGTWLGQNRAKWHEAFDVLSGQRSGHPARIFTYTFRPKGIPAQTVICLSLETTNLPTFAIRYRQPGALFGPLPGGIELLSAPELKAHHILTGPDAAAIEQALTTSFIEFLEANPQLCVESLGDRLLFYFQGRLLEPGDIPVWLDRCVEQCRNLQTATFARQRPVLPLMDRA